jgi:hypothetical protein
LKSNVMLQNMLGGRQAMRTARIAAAALLVSLFIPAVSQALSLSGDSSTYVQSREESDGSNILGGYEYLDFSVQDIGNEAVSFHTGGWLRYDFQDEQFGKRSNSDLQYSYLSFKRATGNTVVNLGRVMVFEGVAAERVDGVYARTDLMGGFGISAFGGAPVETNIDRPGNDVIYGGRISHQGEMYRIGVSVLKEEKNKQDYRTETGIDLWVHPMDKVDVTGRSSYNDITEGWMEHSYALLLGPFANLQLAATASWINYDDYFFQSTTDAFSLRSGIIEPGEKVRILGAEASYPLTDKALVSVDYDNFDYDIAGKADRYGGKVRYSMSESAGAGIGYHRMAGETDLLKYHEYRFFYFRKIGRTDVALDLFDVSYDEPRSGVKDAYSASLAATYALTDAWRLGADLEYSHNPDFDQDIRTFVKVLYHFGAKGGV